MSGNCLGLGCCRAVVRFGRLHKLGSSMPPVSAPGLSPLLHSRSLFRCTPLLTCSGGAGGAAEEVGMPHIISISPFSPWIDPRRAQEELEEKLEKYATRRLPLGFDRHQRRYWWGLAGHRPVVWVEDAEVGASWMLLLIWMRPSCAAFWAWRAAAPSCGLESLRGQWTVQARLQLFIIDRTAPTGPVGRLFNCGRDRRADGLPMLPPNNASMS